MSKYRDLEAAAQSRDRQRVAELEAKCLELRVASEAMAENCAEAERERDEARKDTARLDFLGRAPDNIRFLVYPMQPFEGDWCCVQALEHYRNAPGGFRTLREAIDAARGGESDG